MTSQTTWSSVFFVITAAVAAFAAGQQTRERPSFGSGVVQVEGSVDVASVKTPVTVNGTVNANQAGTWNVAVSNAPTVMVAAPAFLRTGGRYSVIWSTGESETITVASLGAGGWVRLIGTGERWINLTTARSVTAN
jgi:hypothetical protein